VRIFYLSFTYAADALITIIIVCGILLFHIIRKFNKNLKIKNLKRNTIVILLSVDCAACMTYKGIM